jgi:uncharacterized membrane protein YczE
LALGGVLGAGTVLYALTIGPLTQLFLPWCLVTLPTPSEMEDPACSIVY